MTILSLSVYSKLDEEYDLFERTFFIIIFFWSILLYYTYTLNMK